MIKPLIGGCFYSVLMAAMLSVNSAAIAADTPPANPPPGNTTGGESPALAVVSAYLNGLGYVQARFQQINSTGTISTGSLFIHHPGRVRFEYDPPDQTLIIVGGGQIAIFDLTGPAPPRQFPLWQTPFHYWLKPNVDLSGARFRILTTDSGPVIAVHINNPNHPDYGELVLFFRQNPTTLIQWIFTDASGQQTTVVLSAITYPATLSSKLFNIRREITTRGLDRN